MRQTLTFAVSSLAIAGQARGDALTDALASVYEHNPEIAASRAALRAVDEKVPQALAPTRPQVDLSGAAGLLHTDLIARARQSGNYVLQDASLGVSQSLWRGGKTEAGLGEANALIEKQRAILVQTEQGLLLRVVSDHVDIVQDRALVALNLKHEANLKTFFKATNARHDAGQVTKTDLAEARAAAEQATALRISVEGNLAIANAAYEQDVGREPPVEMTDPLAPAEPPATKTEAASLAATDNPAVVIAQFGVTAAEASVDVAAAELAPTISLAGSVSHVYDPLYNIHRHNDETLLIKVTWPLYDGGAAQSRGREARQTVTQNQGLLEATRLAATRAAVEAWEKRHTAEASIKALGPLVEARTIALDGVKKEEAAGARTVLDVLNAELALFQARVDLVQAQHDQAFAAYALATAVGRLTPDLLNLPVDAYDPAANFERVEDRWFGSDIDPAGWKASDERKSPGSASTPETASAAESGPVAPGSVVRPEPIGAIPPGSDRP
jgi:TolC family type I secretion outer membrane protein